VGGGPPVRRLRNALAVEFKDQFGMTGFPQG
jgi:hypothetical protein